MAGRNISVNCKYIIVLHDSGDESYLDILTDWTFCVIRIYNEIKKITLWGWNQTCPQGEVQCVFHLLFSLKAGTDHLPETWRFVILFERWAMTNVHAMDNSKRKC